MSAVTHLLRLGSFTEWPQFRSRGEEGGWKEEERRIEAGEGGSREIESKINFTGFLQPCIPQRG